jgi:hypothetical protein
MSIRTGSSSFDIKQDLRERIQRLINLGKTTPVVSLCIFSPQDLRGIDRVELSKLIDSIIQENLNSNPNSSLTITYDFTDGCTVNLCNGEKLLPTLGGQCAIDYSMRRFKRSYQGASNSYITVRPTSPAIDMF